MPSEIIAFYAVFGVFSLVFFVFVLPRMEKMRRQRKKDRQDDKLHSQQMKVSLEREKIEQEVLREKLKAEAQLDIENKKPKFCEYCGGKITADDVICSCCGAKLQQ